MKWWLLIGVFGLFACVPTEKTDGSQAKLLEIIERLDRDRRDQQRATSEAKARDELRSELKREINDEFQSRFIPLERNLAALVDRMESIESSRQKGVDDESRTLAELKKAARDLGAEVASLTEALTSEREGRTTLERRLTKLEGSLRSQPEDIQRLVEASFDAKFDDKLAPRLSQSDKRLTALSDLVGQSQTKLDASVTSLAKQVADLAADKTDAAQGARIDKLAGDVAAVKTLIDGYAKGSSTAVKSVEAKVDALAGSITTELGKQVAALEARLAKSNDNAALRTELERLLATHATKLGDLSKQLSAATASRDALDKKLGALETELAEIKSDVKQNPKGDRAVGKRLDALEKKLELDNARREQEVKDLALRIDALGATLSQGLETIRKQAAARIDKQKTREVADGSGEQETSPTGPAAKSEAGSDKTGGRANGLEEGAFWEDPFLIAAGVALLLLLGYLLFRRDEEDEAEAQSDAEWESSVNELAQAVGEEELEPKRSVPDQTRAAMEQARLLAAALEAHTQGLHDVDQKPSSSAFEAPATEPQHQRSEAETHRQRPDTRAEPVARELSQPTSRSRNGEPAPSVQSLRVSPREAATGGDEAVRSLLTADPRVLIEPAPRVEWRSDGALSIRFYVHGEVGGREAEDLVHACRELAVRE